MLDEQFLESGYKISCTLGMVCCILLRIGVCHHSGIANYPLAAQALTRASRRTSEIFDAFIDFFLSVDISSGEIKYVAHWIISTSRRNRESIMWFRSYIHVT
jgi:hypothetical protein